MDITHEQSQLIACRAFNPFVTKQLLVKKANGKVVPAPGAGQFKIDRVLADLKQNDKDYGLHAVLFLVNSLPVYAEDIGYSLPIDPDQLLKAKLLDDWADYIFNSAEEI